MAFKEFQLDGLGTVKIYKRRGSRSLRLSLAPNGDVRVTIPSWASYSSGLSFVKSRAAWIENHKPLKTELLKEGQQIGKSHRLHFIRSLSASKASSRVGQIEITVTHPARLVSEDASVQKAAQQACVRALRKQAEQLLPQRLATLAAQHDFTYKSMDVKLLKSRWGSCDQHKNITFNLYLMELPWNLIDYVILHELTHTEVMKHGPSFWDAMKQVAPNVQSLRKAIREYRPILN
jgi:predicted metal-dependent hydrolase